MFNKLKEQCGFTFLEVLISLMALTIAIPMGFSLVNDGLNYLREKQAAQHFTQVKEATETYMREHYQDIYDISSDTVKKKKITISSDLSSYLPTGFKDKNVFSQSYDIGFFRTKRGTQNVLNSIIVTKDGKTVSDEIANKIIPAAANKAGVGFIVDENYVGVSSTVKKNNLISASGSYNVSFDNTDVKTTGISCPGSGHLGTIFSIDDLSFSTDCLYRSAVPNHPELNSMDTNLSMNNSSTLGDPSKTNAVPNSSSSILQQAGGNNINNVGGLQLSPLNGKVVTNSDGSISGFKTKQVVRNADGTIKYGSDGKPELKEVDICSESNYDSSTTTDGKIFYFKYDSDGTPDNSADSIEKNFGLMMCRNQKAYLIMDSGNSLRVTQKYFVTDADFVYKPICSHLSMKPFIKVIPIGIVSSTTEPIPLLAFETWAIDWSSTQWQVRIRAKLESQDSDTWLDFDHTGGNRDMLRALVEVGCSKD